MKVKYLLNLMILKSVINFIWNKKKYYKYLNDNYFENINVITNFFKN